MTKAQPNIDSAEHMRRKRQAYWSDLVNGATARFKTGQVVELLEGRTAPAGSAVVDVGCGTSTLSRLVAARVGAARIVCVDYDALMVEARRAEETDPDVEWRVADARNLEHLGESVGVVSFFDMLHEVYSFGGRGEDDPVIDHGRGIAAVRAVLAASARALEPGGMLIITDDVLPEDPATTLMRCRTPEVAAVVRRVEAEYPSRRLHIRWTGDRDLEIHGHDLAILLTQYNKLKRGDLARWSVEQLEVHQYMSGDDYRRELTEHGMTAHVDVATPPDTLAEWSADFEVLGGRDGFPHKRVAVVAVKDR